jgi:CelD/BcsL family acetyltransferase involved in cellulose biosynthesis
MPAPRWISSGELQERRQQWRQLACASEFPSAFSDPAWLLSWWQSFGEQHEPWTYAWEDDDGSLRGLALLALGRSRLARELSFAGGSWNGLDTLVCAPGTEDEFARLLLRALVERAGEWDVWRILRLRTDCPLARMLLGGAEGLRCAAHDVRLQPYLPLPADVGSYEAQFGSKQRSTQRRKWRKLTALGASARVIADSGEAQPALRELLALRRARAQEQGQRYRHMDDRYEHFLSQAVGELLPDGARLWMLELDGGTLASRLNLIEGEREHSYLLGLGSDHANLSPGNSLELEAIRSAIEQGRTEFELGPGRDEYKYRLGGRDREIAKMVIASPTLRGRTATAVAAADLRLRDSAAAERLRARMGVASERATAAERPAESDTAAPATEQA